MNNLPETDFLLHLTDFGIKLGLEKSVSLLEMFGNPHLKYRSILVAGTNGKGSVAKTLATILCEAGYKTGLYISPHLVDLEERISVDGRNITASELAKKAGELQEILKETPYHMYPTFFEAMTVIAFSFFADRGIDVLVCEVGMGGRFDATNVLPSSLEIITRIGIEHTQFLGKTYPEIANEKAGIIKTKSMVITARQEEDAMKVIRDKAREKKAVLHAGGRDFKARRKGVSPSGQVFDFYGGRTYLNVHTPLLGKHQVENMSLVLEAAYLLGRVGLPVDRRAVYGGMEKTVWPCRFQVARENPLLVIDGAHNPDGIRTLVGGLRSIFPGERFSFLMGILKDKDWRRMIRTVLRYEGAGEIVFTAAATERALDPSLLASFARDCGIRVSAIPSYRNAYRYAVRHPANWCVCGSLYLCGNILPLTGRRKKK